MDKVFGYCQPGVLELESHEINLNWHPVPLSLVSQRNKYMGNLISECFGDKPKKKNGAGMVRYPGPSASCPLYPPP